MSDDEVADVCDELDRIASKAHTLGLRLIGELHHQGSPVALGAKPLVAELSERLGISEAQARRRVDEAVSLGYG